MGEHMVVTEYHYLLIRDVPNTDTSIGYPVPVLVLILIKVSPDTTLQQHCIQLGGRVLIESKEEQC